MKSMFVNHINDLILLSIGPDLNLDLLSVHPQNEVLENLKTMNNQKSRHRAPPAKSVTGFPELPGNHRQPVLGADRKVLFRSQRQLLRQTFPATGPCFRDRPLPEVGCG